MNALLDVKENQSQGVSGLDWRDEYSRHTVGIIRKAQIFYKGEVFSDKEPYDKIKWKGTTLPLSGDHRPYDGTINKTRIEEGTSMIDELQKDVAALKNDMQYLRRDTDELKSDVKNIAIEKLPDIKVQLGKLDTKFWIVIVLLAGILSTAIAGYYKI